MWCVDTFLAGLTSCSIWNTSNLVQDNHDFQIVLIVIFLVIFGTRMHILFITKVNIPLFILSDIDPPIMLTIMVNTFLNT